MEYFFHTRAHLPNAIYQEILQPTVCIFHPFGCMQKNQQTSFIEFKESIDHFWSRQQENMLHNHLEVWSKTINMLFLIDFYKIHTNIINLSPKVPFKNSNRDARSIKPVHVTRMSIYLLVKKTCNLNFIFSELNFIVKIKSIIEF